MKQCPSCQNNIAPQLVVCPFCGHDFEQAQPEPDAGKQTMMGIPASNFMAELNKLREEAKQEKQEEENTKQTMFGLPALTPSPGPQEDEEEEDAFEPTQIIPSMNIPDLVAGTAEQSAASMSASVPRDSVMRTTMPGGLPALNVQKQEDEEVDKPFKARPNSRSTMMLGSFSMKDALQQAQEEGAGDEISDDEDDNFAQTMVVGPSAFSVAVDDESAFSRMQPAVDHSEDKESSTQTGLNIRELAAGMNQGAQDNPERSTMFSFPSPFQKTGDEDSLLEMSEEDQEDDAATAVASASSLGQLLGQTNTPEDNTRQRLLDKLRSSKSTETEAQESRPERSTMFGIPGINRSSPAPEPSQAQNQKGIFNLAKSSQEEDELAKTGVLGSSSYVFSGNDIKTDTEKVETEDAFADTQVLSPDEVASSLGDVNPTGETLPFSFSVKEMLEQKEQEDQKRQTPLPQSIEPPTPEPVEDQLPAPIAPKPSLASSTPKAGIIQKRKTLDPLSSVEAVNVHAETEPQLPMAKDLGAFELELPSAVPEPDADPFQLDSPVDASFPPVANVPASPAIDVSGEMATPTQNPSDVPAASAETPTFAAEPVVTPEPVATPEPTYTPEPVYTPEPSTPVATHTAPVATTTPSNTSSQSALTNRPQTALQPDGGPAVLIQRIFCGLTAVILLASAGLGFAMQLKAAGSIGAAAFGAAGALGLLAIGGAAVGKNIRRILMFVIGVVGIALFALLMTQSLMGIGSILLCAGALLALAAGVLTFF